jgi:hypothetical protein
MAFYPITKEQLNLLRIKDGKHFLIPDKYLEHVLIDDFQNLFFQIIDINGSLVGWNRRAHNAQPRWSQTLLRGASTRFCSWSPEAPWIISKSNMVCICEGPLDALALAPVIPQVISANTARVSNGIIKWCAEWKLDVYLALDRDPVDLKTGRSTGYSASTRVKRSLEKYGCRVSILDWPTSPGLGHSATHIKDPAHALAHFGTTFHEVIRAQVDLQERIWRLTEVTCAAE